MARTKKPNLEKISLADLSDRAGALEKTSLADLFRCGGLLFFARHPAASVSVGFPLDMNSLAINTALDRGGAL